MENKMRKSGKLAEPLKGAAGLLLLLAVLYGLSGCGFQKRAGEQAETALEQGADKTAENTVEKAPAVETFRDNDYLYQGKDPFSVKTMYLTVRSGNSTESSDHSWEEVNAYSAFYYDRLGIDRYKVEAILQEGDENGPTAGGFGYGADTPNATVQIRGQTSSRREQKNYKIEIKKNKGLLEDQRTISLNKHVSEGLRFRNKLCYDLMAEIPQMMSLRTQFVHLYVKDETASGTSGNFEDYGLYTQVEQLNKTGLKNHGLDSTGHLYKINYFEFFRYPETIKPEDDPGFNEAAFSELLECKGDHDHSKLMNLLDDLNDYQIPIEQILRQHFSEENIAYWLAFQMLVGNVDTNTRNLYIYSPQNSEKWYFISWDNDIAFMREEYALTDYTEAQSWQTGISNYWGNVLINRCLKSESFRQTLNQAVEDVKQHLNKEHLTELVRGYQSVVEPYAFSLPDSTYEPITREKYNQIAAELPGLVDEYYEDYLLSLKKPMPFYIGTPEIEDGKLEFEWDASYDFNSESITYSFELARNLEFSDMVAYSHDLRTTEVKTDLLEPGQYFIRVRAKNESGYEQDAFDYYVTDSGKSYGIRCFYVLPDGSIGEDTYED